MAVDIGNDAVNKSGFTNAGWTLVNKNNPATIPGFVTQVEIFVNIALTSIEIGIFTEGPADTLTTRSNAVFGAYAPGYHAIVTNLLVAVGDFIGFRAPVGNLDADGVGAGYWWLNGDYIPCVGQAFNLNPAASISIGGTITAPVTGIQDKSANMGAKMIAGKLI